MKKIFLILAFIGFGLSNAYAQKTIPDVHKTCKEQNYRRTEIILPQIEGYNCYKADLHTHTIYSDGEMTPREKVREAWYDGLDILAITDHLESRRYSQYMLNALAPYNPDGKPYKYHHAGSAKLRPDGTDAGITTDMNATFEEAKECLKKEGYPITLIKGTEISRKPQTEGHFNALFVKDINALYNIDTKKTFRNVHKQGGIVIHNHPAYRRETTDKTEWQEEVYKEGLIDGVEIVNGLNFYPKMIRRCVDEKLAMVAGTDSHRPTSGQFKDYGFFRTMTIILAKDRSEKAIKDAILKQRTIAYSGGELMGEEKWLTELVKASVSCQDMGVSKKKGLEYQKFVLINKSSLTYKLRWGKAAYCELGPFKSAVVELRAKDGNARAPKFTVDNMWMMDYKHPSVTLEVIQ